MAEWIVVGILDGVFVAPNGQRFENTQVIARVWAQEGEKVWDALARQIDGDKYIVELLSHRSKDRAQHIIAYELTGKRQELDEDRLRGMLMSAVS